MRDNHAIRSAAENGHAAIVKLLLAHPLVDPFSQNYYALRYAEKNFKIGIVNMLKSDPRYDHQKYVTQTNIEARKIRHDI